MSKDRIKSGIRPNAGIVNRNQPLKLTLLKDGKYCLPTLLSSYTRFSANKTVSDSCLFSMSMYVQLYTVGQEQRYTEIIHEPLLFSVAQGIF
jgi:hypothetical protein